MTDRDALHYNPCYTGVPTHHPDCTESFLEDGGDITTRPAPLDCCRRERSLPTFFGPNPAENAESILF